MRARAHTFSFAGGMLKTSRHLRATVTAATAIAEKPEDKIEQNRPEWGDFNSFPIGMAQPARLGLFVDRRGTSVHLSVRARGAISSGRSRGRHLLNSGVVNLAKLVKSLNGFRGVAFWYFFFAILLTTSTPWSACCLFSQFVANLVVRSIPQLRAFKAAGAWTGRETMIAHKS